MNKRAFIASAFAAAIVAPALLAAQAAQEEPKGVPVKAPTAYKAEKCYGIAKARMNDCSNRGNNSCGGTQKINNDPKAYIYVPEGYCNRIVGGSLAPKA